MSSGGGNIGKKLYNNGVITKYFAEGDPIPEGFVPGMKPLSEERKREMLNKRKQTCLKKYGYENTFQVPEIQKKIKEGNVVKWGYEVPSQSKEVKDKVKKTNLERYGVEYYQQSDKFKEKSKKTSLERYGTEYYTQTDEYKERVEKTCLERYGTKYPMQSDEVKAKVKKTHIERYGGFTWESEELRDKVKKTNLERYGVENPNQCSGIREKIKQTNIERYGVENPSQSEEIKRKRTETIINRYGVENAFQSEVIMEKARNTLIERYGVEHPLQSKELLKKMEDTCQERYNVSFPCQRPECKAAGSNDSSENRAFADILDRYGIDYEREFRIKRFSFDFKIGNILIDIDPTATHNTMWNPYRGEGIKETYHKEKSEVGEGEGYHVIHVFDWDDRDKLVRSLLVRDSVYARKCELREVSRVETDSFLNEYHLQNSCRGQDIRLGLYFNDMLISLMTFGKPRYNKNYQYELLRYCSSKNVIGGAEKLFTNFMREYNPESIISYCDRSKFRGDVYKKIGFILLNEGKPSKHWCDVRSGRHITDNLLRQRGFDQIFGTHYGKGTSNEELIIQNNFSSVYDCGQDTYVRNI